MAETLFDTTIPARDLKPGMRIVAREHRGAVIKLSAVTVFPECVIITYVTGGQRSFKPDHQVTLG